MKWKLFALVIINATANAQNCESVIALSKTTSSQVSDRASIEQQAANFCSDYKKSVQSGTNMSAGGSYGVFSASVGMSNQSVEAVASKYCSSQDSYAASKSAYRNYVESISNNAYAAYERCLELSKRDLKFSVDSAAILPEEFSMSASFVSSDKDRRKTTVEVSASDGVSCTADGKASGLVEVATGSTVAIHCKRADKTKPGFVRLTNKESGSPDPLTLPWEASTAEGISVGSLLRLQLQVQRLEARLSRLGTQSGTIILRAVDTRRLDDASKCPGPPDAYRGETNGLITFATPFAEQPEVHVGLTSIDIGGGANNGQRLQISVKSVDRSGFRYSFYTWCDTAISAASASWIAISK